MPLRAYVAVCLPFCHPGGGGGGGGQSIFFYKLIRVSPFYGAGQCNCLSISLYLFVSPDIPCPGLPQTFFLHCLKG